MHPATVLVVDDDTDVLTAARLLLGQHFRRVVVESNPGAIEDHLHRGIDVYLLDMNFAIGRNTGAEGIDWLRRIRDAQPGAVVVLMTAYGDLNVAVEAMKEGAADFVLKPWQNEKLVATISVAADLAETRQRVEPLKETLRPDPPAFIAETAPMQRVLKMVERAAPTDANVLIVGENGTGKELIAQALHGASPRRDEAMVSVDVGAIPETLLESELFGHTQGAFTGADKARSGRLLAAHRGTLFLDEIGNLPSSAQAKLLRVLETREVTPLGSDTSTPVDIRLVCATNANLDENFREDLRYRINTIEIALPPLRERREDIPLLVEHFVELHARKYRLAAKQPDAAAMQGLVAHAWPGNVRELSHAIERALILAEGDTLGIDDFGLARRGTRRDSLDLKEHEQFLVETALERHGGNISRAAEALGITRAALYRRLGKYRSP